jgi:hypothetical protein
MNAPQAGAGAPQSGSVHYFTELYAPPAARALLRQVLALEAEIRTSLRGDLDHGVAHARLEWWEQEAARTAAGSASHPMLRSLQAAGAASASAATLTDWILAARIELAGGLTDASRAAELAHLSIGAGFALIATLLGADSAAARALGAATARLHAPLARPDQRAQQPGNDPQCDAALAAIAAIAPHSQAPLRPLLVWVALALRRAKRGQPAPPQAAVSAPLILLSDNIHAWRAARAADAGRVHRLLRMPQP